MFSLSTAPEIIMKLMLNAAKILYSRGIRASLYLDDWLLGAHSYDHCLKDLQTTLRLTEELGLLVNKEKSLSIPSQEILYLGMKIWRQIFRAFTSPLRIQLASLKLRSLLRKNICSTRKLMSLVGTLSSLEQFVPLGRLNLRPLQFHLNHHWSKEKDLETMSISITTTSKAAFGGGTNRTNSKKVSTYLKRTHTLLCSNASDSGWGATLNKLEVLGLFSETQKDFHINHKELLAIFLALRSFEGLVMNRVVQVNADNTTAYAYIAKQEGTHSISLYETAKNLLLWVKERNVVLMTRFI
ncbi:uncharacterized protein [Palaemon carinicauda]|uniref:uncharacterized protein n=1 Tax=Palaemon carinicauda TaxID=392227 RepID=UPI0035B66F9F